MWMTAIIEFAMTWVKGCKASSIPAGTAGSDVAVQELTFWSLAVLNPSLKVRYFN
jgi:hypothetical protein